MGLIVNKIGQYEGTFPLDFLDGESTAYFDIQASGVWELKIHLVTDIQIVVIPTIIEGSGDDVVFLYGGEPVLLKIDASEAASNFVVWAYSENNRDLLVKEVAPYTGTILAKDNTIVLAVTAEGRWSIEVTTK